MKNSVLSKALSKLWICCCVIEDVSFCGSCKSMEQIVLCFKKIAAFVLREGNLDEIKQPRSFIWLEE